jgi:CMP-N-acetylneuraminic acid synthetase
MTIWAAVFARGGSKGLPGKNLLLLGGLPLVAHSVRLGLEIPGVSTVVCSTDSPEIKAVAEQHGASVPFLRPTELAGDESPEWLSWKHLAQYLRDTGASPEDLLVSLPATSPLRVVADVEAAIAKYRDSGADVVVSYTPAARSPWFNMVAEGADGFLHTVIATDGDSVSRRQDAPKVFDLATVVYVTTLGFVLSADGLFDGKVTGIEVAPERAIDIDTQLDFDIAEFLHHRKTGHDAL